jgi:hypothetical protein
MILSYCWGKTGSSARTTSQNLHQRTVGFDIAELPKTIKDAVNITHKLGIRFIWVDSVCIIQEEPGHADFVKESARMHEYYGNAYITIVAASSADNEGGCAVIRPIRQTPLDHCQIGGPDGGAFAPSTPLTPSDQQYAEESGHPLWIHLPKLDLLVRYSTCIDKSIWATRGWTFQERFLSNRVVFWTGLGLWWDCGSFLSSEYDTDDYIVDDDRFRPNLLQRLSTEKLTNHVWFKQLTQFSGCKFTVPTDRLIALSGMAKRIQMILDGRTASSKHVSAPPEPRLPLSIPITYLGGVWSNYVKRSLVWYSRAERNRRHQVYVGPSWSFLSIDGPVEWRQTGELDWEEQPSISLPDLIASHEVKVKDSLGEVQKPKDKYVLEILDHRLFYQNDPFGALSPGCTLTVRGVLSQINLCTTGRSQPRQFDPLVWCINETAWAWDDISHRFSGPLFALATILDRHGVLYCLIVAPTHRTPREYTRLGILKKRYSKVCGDYQGAEKALEYAHLLNVDVHSEPVVIDLV